MSPQPLLRTDSLTRIFPGVIANDAVSLDLYPAEVHALLGENGAGKSTFVSMLCGATAPDAGRLLWEGRPVQFRSPLEARKAGISMVYQHMNLIPYFTVLENVLLQLPGGGGRQNKLPFIRQRMRALCEEFNLEIDLDSRIEELPMGTRQMVDILKALYHDCRLLILDEPTAVLTPPEVQRLFAFIRALQARKGAVLIIAHKISEVMEISDRISVLRDGRHIDTVMRAKTNPGQLARMMVGRDLPPSEAPSSVPTGHRPAPVVSFRDLREDGSGLETLKGLDLDLHPGEIVGIAGVDGNGQRRLFDVLSGRNRTVSGELEVLGKDPRQMARRQYLNLPVAFVPEDRHHMGLILGMSVAENLVMQSSSRPPYAIGKHFIRPRVWRQQGEKAVAAYGIKASSVDRPVSTLSGGNQQKVLLARELQRDPKVLVLTNPTRGLDLGAVKAIHSTVRKQKEKGCAILLISSDLEEILALSDRLAVLHGGRFMAVIDRPAVEMKTLGLLMAGEHVA